MDLRLAALVLAACSTSQEPAPEPAPPAPVPVPAAPAKPAPLVPPLRLPEGAAPLAYDLRLELDPAAPAFTGHVAIRVQLSAPADHVWLNADELDFTHASFRAGGAAPAPLATVATGDGVRAFGFGRTLPAGEVVLELDYTGGTKHAEEGLFRQRQGSRWYLFSQGESVYARRFVPCFDEPRFKTPWRVTLDVPAHDVALANMPQQSEHALADGRREVAFAETPAMASYLVAVAVGPFELVDAGTVGRAHVPLRVAVLAGQRGRVPLVAARVPQLVDTAEQLLDDSLPLAKLDLVVVPHLFGAMENPGLITFDARILVGDSAATARELDRVAAHELVHQWFGDLVTPAWWDDLWLAEAFATWLGERIVVRLGRSSDPALRRALSRQDALAADDDPGAPPLRPTIERAADAEDEFSAIAYDKGAAVLETIAAWQGDDAMFAALRAYLHAHRGGTATARDLYAAFGAEPARALAGLVEHAGVPVVELALHCDAKPVLAAHVRGGFAVPVCARYGDGGTAVHRTCALVADRGALALDGGCPSWVVGNDRAAYYEVAWQTQPPLGPLPPLAELAPGEVIAAGEDVAAGFERGDVTAADALAALDRLVRDHSPYAQLGALAIAHAIDPVVDDATRPRWSSWLAHRFVAPSGTRAVDYVLDDGIAELYAPTKVDPDGAFASWLAGHGELWDWMRFVERPATRTRAWHAVHGHIPAIVARLGVDPPTIDGLGKLCDPGARAELVAALPAKDKHVMRALAAIDRCVAGRARAGEVAAALR